MIGGVRKWIVCVTEWSPGGHRGSPVRGARIIFPRVFSIVARVRVKGQTMRERGAVARAMAVC